MDLRTRLREKANSEKAKIYQRFFKTGPGEYGEGDIFIGLTMPEIRTVIKDFRDMELEGLKDYLDSKIHEERMAALLILVEKYRKNSEREVVDFYLDNRKAVNNWDLVDLTASQILGKFLVGKDKKILYKFAKSEDLWEKRISMISCFAFIKDGDFDDALAIAKILLDDKHDLIHKAVGWVLREIGKKDLEVLKKFLRDNYSKLPRTTLRYAIERFPEDERKGWLRGAR